MKILLKNSYLFLIFFILLVCKNSYHQISNLYQDKYMFYLSPYKFNEELILFIDEDNLHINDYVLSNNHLIGVIDKVYNQMSIIKLLTNKDTLLQISINDCYGLLKYENNKSIVTNINNYCDVKTGDNVYIGDISVGEVSGFIIDNNLISNTYLIKLDYLNTTIKKINIIKGDKYAYFN